MQNRMLQLSIASVQYGDKDFFVTDLFSDSLSLHLNLLSELGEVYRQRIVDMVARCDRTARLIGHLACDLYLASGGDTEKTEIHQKLQEKNITMRSMSRSENGWSRWMQMIHRRFVNKKLTAGSGNPTLSHREWQKRWCRMPDNRHLSGKWYPSEKKRRSIILLL